MECPTGPTYFEEPITHHCYHVNEATPLAWGDARNACLGLGPRWDLASIRSDDERNFIDYPPVDPAGDVWIGGNDQAVEDTFVWSSGEPWDYTMNWVAGEPNPSATDSEDCVLFDEIAGNIDLFVDFDCATPLGYVCERTPAGR
jgi:hypothetical protein